MNETNELAIQAETEPNRLDRYIVKGFGLDEHLTGAFLLGVPIAAGYITGKVVYNNFDNDKLVQYEGQFSKVAGLEARKSNIDELMVNESGVVKKDLQHSSDYLSGEIQLTKSQIPQDAIPNNYADDLGFVAGLAVGAVCFVAIIKRSRTAFRRTRASNQKGKQDLPEQSV